MLYKIVPKGQACYQIWDTKPNYCAFNSCIYLFFCFENPIFKLKKNILDLFPRLDLVENQFNHISRLLSPVQKGNVL